MDWLGLFDIVDFVCGVVEVLKPKEEEQELQPDELTGEKFYFDPDKQEYLQETGFLGKLPKTEDTSSSTLGEFLAGQ